MKKIFFLVDVDNCRFLIVNENNKWNLPTINRINDMNNIKEKFLKKYNINIKEDFTIIEKKEKYIFIKCTTDDKIYDKNIFNVGVINEIQSLISNKIQRQLLFNISLKIAIEILNDSFWLGIILTTEDKIKNEIMKALLTDFLLCFSSSFCEEILKYKFGGIKEQNLFSYKQIRDLRTTYLKKCPLYNSKKIKTIIREMGIDFDHYVFDNVLFFINDEFMDINSRTWKNRHKENFDFYNGIILSPRRWIENLYPSLNDTFENLRKSYVDEFVNRINKQKIKYKRYSTKKLFNNNLSNDEKIYILQRIGLLKNTMFLSKTFGNGNFININGYKKIKISFDTFLQKVKANLITMLWNDNVKNNLPFLNQILEDYPKEICEDFFSINRKCRNNIHYGFYNELTESEICILEKYQDVYLDYVIKEFENQISIKFGINYKISLTLAKIKYWASH